MSTILKALKKLEQDKLRKGEGRSEIAFDILKTSPTSRRSAVLPLVVSVSVVALVAAAAIYFMTVPGWIGDMASTPPSLPQMPTETVVSQTKASVPAPAVRLQEIPQAKESRQSAEEKPVIYSSARPREQKPVAAKDQKAKEMTTEQRWVVNGIAWQENQEQRLAVINGFPVMTGTVIDDAEVTSIEEDRVVLVHEGRILSVPLKMSLKD